MLPGYIIAIIVILSLISIAGIITTSLFAAKVIYPEYECEELVELVATQGCD